MIWGKILVGVVGTICPPGKTHFEKLYIYIYIYIYPTALRATRHRACLRLGLCCSGATNSDQITQHRCYENQLVAWSCGLEIFEFWRPWAAILAHSGSLWAPWGSLGEALRLTLVAWDPPGFTQGTPLGLQVHI